MAVAKNVDDYLARQSEIKNRQAELDTEFAGVPMSDEARSEFLALKDEHQKNEKVIEELRFRATELARLAGNDAAREPGATFNIGLKPSERDLYDLAGYRSNSRSEEHQAELLHEGAMRAVDQASFAGVNKEDAQAHVEKLMERALHEQQTGEIARRIIATGSPLYRRAFPKAIAGKELNNEERTAMAVGAGSTGGYGVPFTLDPTIIPTSNFSVNPFRAISRVITLTGSNTWEGVSSGGITASMDTEASEVSDDSPTLAQPTATLRMGRAFVRYSFELEQDYASLSSQLGELFAQARDDLEATEFTTGSGTAPHPLGILETANTTGIGTAAFVFTAGTAAFVVGDVYKVENALAPRWRPRASFVANRATYNAIRQFDTAGGASLFVDNLTLGLDNQVPTPGKIGTRLLGYPALEDSAMSSTYATTGQLSLLMGDFNQFVIVDGVGMNVERIQNLFNTSNNLPTSQRGLFATWRYGSTVAAPTAFKVLKVL